MKNTTAATATVSGREGWTMEEDFFGKTWRFAPVKYLFITEGPGIFYIEGHSGPCGNEKTLEAAMDRIEAKPRF